VALRPEPASPPAPPKERTPEPSTEPIKRAAPPTLASGTHEFTVIAMSSLKLQCHEDWAGLRGTIIPVSYDERSRRISVGKLSGPPMMPTFGTGQLSTGAATLNLHRVYNPVEMPSCRVDERVVSQLKLVGRKKLSLAFSGTRSRVSGQCPPWLETGTCADSWRATLEEP
jgi:hypothetical protein